MPKICPETSNSLPKRKRGRPPLPPIPKAGRISLDGPIPAYVGYGELKALIKQYRGRGYDEKKLRFWIETGVFPSYIEEGIGTAWASVPRRTFKWSEVRECIDSRMKKVEPSKGIVINGQYAPPKASGE